MKKNDLILILVVAVIAIAGFSAYAFLGLQESGKVVVEVDGSLYGTYDLNENQEIMIHDTNILIIENGEANMIEADCPDQICVEHRPISKNGETIVCLPNKVVVTITDSEESELDAVVN